MSGPETERNEESTTDWATRVEEEPSENYVEEEPQTAGRDAPEGAIEEVPPVSQPPPTPDDADVEEIGQYRSVDALRAALADESIDGTIAVFEDAESETVLTDDDVTPDHAWIGQPRYERITFVADEGDISDFVGGLDYPLA